MHKKDFFFFFPPILKWDLAWFIKERECYMCSNFQDLLWRNWYYVKLDWMHVSRLDFILDIWTFSVTVQHGEEKRPWDRDCVWLWWTKKPWLLTNTCFESRFKGTFKVMELGMEVGRALWVGSRSALWKVVTRGQPTGWHLWSASHCLYFRSSKVASFLSLFGVCLLKHELGCFSWNNKSFGI